MIVVAYNEIIKVHSVNTLVASELDMNGLGKLIN